MDWLGNSPSPASLLFSSSPLQSTWKAQYSEWFTAITVFLASSSFHLFCPTYGESKEQGTFTGCFLRCAAACITPRWWQVQAASAPRPLHGALHHCKRPHAHNSSKDWKQKCSNLAALTPHALHNGIGVNPPNCTVCDKGHCLFLIHFVQEGAESGYLEELLEELDLFNMSVLPHRSSWLKQELHCLGALSKASLSTAPWSSTALVCPHSIQPTDALVLALAALIECGTNSSCLGC